MPRTGAPRSYTPGSSEGAPVTWTDFGPPLRITPTGFRSATSAAVMVWGTISLKTCASRTRRAISWAYWAPKSTTRTVSKALTLVLDGGRPPSAPHPDALQALEGLALGHQGGGDHDLRLLELLDRLVPARGHGGPQRAAEVE